MDVLLNGCAGASHLHSVDATGAPCRLCVACWRRNFIASGLAYAWPLPPPHAPLSGAECEDASMTS